MVKQDLFVVIKIRMPLVLDETLPDLLVCQGDSEELFCSISFLIEKE
jgi:hypothetical protein